MNTTTLIILTGLYLLFIEFPRILIISAYDHMDTDNFVLQFLKRNIIYLLYGFLIFSLLLGIMKLGNIQSLDILLITFNNLSLGLISIYILKRNGFQEKSKKIKNLLIVEGSFLFIIFGYVASFELL